MQIWINYGLEEKTMEKYVDLELKVIRFESEDIITESDPQLPIG